MNIENIKTMSRKLAALAIAAGAMLPIMVHAESPLKPRALVIMLDGLRGDAVENLEMTNLQRLIAGKWQPGYKCTWSLGASTIRDGSTESAPNHVAIATGMTVKKTGISWNPDLLSRGTRSDRLPTWLARLAKLRPGTKPLHIFSWYGDLRMSPDYGVKFIFDRDAPNATMHRTPSCGTSTVPTTQGMASATIHTRRSITRR